MAAHRHSAVLEGTDAEASHSAAVRVKMHLHAVRQKEEEKTLAERTVGAVSGAVISTVTISQVLVPMRSVPFCARNNTHVT
jgi:hypothetical protein